MRRVFVELPDEEKERLARHEEGHKLEHVGWLKTVDANARWQAHCAQILKGHSFAQGLSNPALFVHLERDIGLLVHGDDFMVEMPTREEVLILKYDGKCTGKFHSVATL